MRALAIVLCFVAGMLSAYAGSWLGVIATIMGQVGALMVERNQ